MNLPLNEEIRIKDHLHFILDTSSVLIVSEFCFYVCLRRIKDQRRRTISRNTLTHDGDVVDGNRSKEIQVMFVFCISGHSVFSMRSLRH